MPVALDILITGQQLSSASAAARLMIEAMGT
jgi:hypothetical protein